MTWHDAVGFLGVTRREVAGLIVLIVGSAWLLPTIAPFLIPAAVLLYAIPDVIRVTREFIRYARSKPWLPFLLVAAVLVLVAAFVVSVFAIIGLNGIVFLATGTRYLPSPYATIGIVVGVFALVAALRFARGYLRWARANRLVDVEL